METLLILAAVMMFWILPAVLTGALAQMKGYDFTLFFVAGLLFSVFAALFIAILLPDRLEPAPDGPEPATGPSRPARSPVTVALASLTFMGIVVAVALTRW
jgi:hypothetical protein